MVPLTEPVNVFTVALLASRSVSVMPCDPEPEATVPWFFTVTPNVTLSPLEGLPGVQVTDDAIRSELATGATVSDVGLV
ncbi:hypothetical protein GCM10029978_061240 [Actinoallomurus acanthiterrae]